VEGEPGDRGHFGDEEEHAGEHPGRCGGPRRRRWPEVAEHAQARGYSYDDEFEIGLDALLTGLTTFEPQE